MGEEARDTLKNRVALDLNERKRKFSRQVGEICRSFRDLGLETAVWHPKKIYSANIGGLDAESYIGYSRVEGKWGLNVRTIERDRESGAFVNQRVYPLESSGNVEMVVCALKSVGELWKEIARITEQELELLSNLGEDFCDFMKP
jgi:hypothetical protein